MSTGPPQSDGVRLNALLVRLVWLCMWPALGLAGYLAIADVMTLQRERDHRATALVDAVTTSIDQDLNARIAALEMLAESASADEQAGPRDLYRDAQAFQRNFGSHVVLAGLDMQMRFNTRVPLGQALPGLPRPSGRAATPIAIASQRPAVGDVFQGPVGRQRMVAIAVPVLRAGHVTSVLLSTFETRQFQKYLDAAGLPEDWILSLVDSSNALIVQQGAPEGRVGAPLDTSGAISVAARTAPWRVVLEIPPRVSRAPLLRAAGLLALAIGLATAIGLIGGTLAGRRLSEAVASLAQPPRPGQPSPRIVEIAEVRRRLDEAARRQQSYEATLRTSEQRFRRLFQEAPLAMALFGSDDALVDLNARFVQQFGYARGDFQTVADWWKLAYAGSESQEQAARAWAEIMTGRSEGKAGTIDALERRIRCKDGSPRDVLLSGICIGDEFLATLVDITEHKHALGRLQAHVERLELLDQLTTAIAERQDLDSICKVVLRRLEERLPVDFSCMLTPAAGGDALVVQSIGAGSADRAWQIALGEGQVLTLDAQDLARCRRGEVIQDSNGAATAAARFPFSRRLADCGLNALMLVPLSSSQDLVGLMLVARTRPHSFSSGEHEFLRQLCAHLGLAVRQARLHEALQGAYNELRQTREAVMQQERLRALGQMASGVAHDINNAVSPVLLYTETLLEHEPDLSARARKYLQTIARAIEDVTATVARLRQFYRQKEAGLKPAPVQLPDLIEQVVELTRARWHDMPLQRGIVIKVSTDLAPGLPPAMGVEGEIREALTNLVFNAVDAMPEGGTLTLGARPGPGASVELTVADTGLGMDEETRQRCIEPFFTTKGERGTGLGLAMVYGFTQRHGADLQIASTPGLGTSVTLVLPLASGAEPIAGAPAAPRPSRRLHLLLVDDDPVVLTSMRETLEMEGHKVDVADGGRAGFETFEASHQLGAGFDAVITDLGMPYVDGRQLARLIKERSPSTPVILVTGWGQRLVADGEIPPHVDRVLGKPPRLRDLREALASLTDGGHG